MYFFQPKWVIKALEAMLNDNSFGSFTKSFAEKHRSTSDQLPGHSFSANEEVRDNESQLPRY